MNPTLRKCMEDQLKSFADKRVSPEQINHGLCDQFMQAVIEAYPIPEEITTEDLEVPEEVYDHLPGHYWILCGGKHYDSECLDGVEDWKELPIFKRHFLEQNPKWYVEKK